MGGEMSPKSKVQSRESVKPVFHLINTPLQRGVGEAMEPSNPFKGFILLFD